MKEVLKIVRNDPWREVIGLITYYITDDEHRPTWNNTARIVNRRITRFIPAIISQQVRNNIIIKEQLEVAWKLL